MKDNRSTRNLMAENRDLASICCECPYNKCVEDIYKGYKAFSHCDRYIEEYRKLQLKYGVKNVGGNIHYEKEEKI